MSSTCAILNTHIQKKKKKHQRAPKAAKKEKTMIQA
jgi:hypothetical protein